MAVIRRAGAFGAVAIALAACGAFGEAPSAPQPGGDAAADAGVFTVLPN